ncbi:beta-ketoacyl-ACP synthase II [Labilibaculum sp. A4]|uniref:3-oxoacyl-[acyl-carrier-protein] synthase 2 n=2 Tax=Labilibaculum TaxID=2060722 RepID=A0A425Y6E5_9BACT|nr:MULTISPECIES: beta-ketoacyl-ACP synthase II [Labilibaculum]MDQ1772203.1 beta-ketoacyl-ACP synthase II [Labilibaculum euxinus]MUP39311.1 beta-ketoacyl-ACP synthase II [Labilibaculum euxinus]MVB08516.1 beta-ketoacyl-ACP synthase II [Labilibaculum euxinus]MWN77905.1 beta-ketoacyl-ACP synthase II [Labilibaculum euxinus]PKQ67160.1 beta-ketoacyl-[acyl-carrier-protein] synthase II [Labilibaculum manganireducens]
MEFRRVVVTGLGTINPIGNSVAEYWDSLENGVGGSGLITHFDASKFKTQFACEVKNFEPNDHFDRKEVRKLDLYAQYALVAAKQAIEDSNLDLESEDLTKAGVIWGSGIGGIKTFLDEVTGYANGDGTPRFSPFFIPKMISDIAAGHISMKYGFQGPNYGTVSACASASHAMIDAMNYIRLGKANIFITGGSEASINEAGLGGFNSMQALSTNNEEYKTASRPFCNTRDGFVMGEGSGCLIFEEYEHAKKRGAKIYAEIVGGGMSGDAYHLTATHPEGRGAINAMKMALEDACLKPEEIDYINVHGTSTPVGDIPETKAVQTVFGDHAYKLNISATKSMTGHLLGAAGAVEAIACILAINNQTVPPTINFSEADPNIDEKLNLTLHKAQKREIRTALSNTFGFGGHNASVIFKSFIE